MIADINVCSSFLLVAYFLLVSVVGLKMLDTFYLRMSRSKLCLSSFQAVTVYSIRRLLFCLRCFVLKKKKDNLESFFAKSGDKLLYAILIICLDPKFTSMPLIIMQLKIYQN